MLDVSQDAEPKHSQGTIELEAVSGLLLGFCDAVVEAGRSPLFGQTRQSDELLVVNHSAYEIQLLIDAPGSLP